MVPRGRGRAREERNRERGGGRENERVSWQGNCYPKFKLGCRLPLTRFAMGLVQQCLGLGVCHISRPCSFRRLGVVIESTVYLSRLALFHFDLSSKGRRRSTSPTVHVRVVVTGELVPKRLVTLLVVFFIWCISRSIGTRSQIESMEETRLRTSLPPTDFRRKCLFLFWHLKKVEAKRCYFCESCY